MGSIFAIAYSFLPVVNSWAFLPQAVKLYRSSPIEARSVSLSAWLMWFGASFVSLMYGLTNLHDTLFCISAGVSVFWNALIISLTLWKRGQELQFGFSRE
ncbi:MAG TPA: hypothetical protein PKI93_04290 [Alphaproteobacteria bacterium]|nr:hypothetical protein [Alphaproteobacteria bacterium]HNS44086.1 hypothetical protein [Alphaproteobacteria bacterium]